jgi:hypothetical protein
MTKKLIINNWDMGKLQNLVSGRCRTIVFRRCGETIHVVLNGLGAKDYLAIKKPLNNMALYH